jgi:hypothetical protein
MRRRLAVWSFDGVPRVKAIMTAAMIVALSIPLSVSASAEDGGCLKYGAGGAVAGHFAGHHTMSGAVIGCGIGAAKRHRVREEEPARDRAYQQGLRDQDYRNDNRR